MVVDVAAADAVQDRRALRLPGELEAVLWIAQQQLAARGSGGVGQALELQVGEDVGVLAVAVLLHRRGVERVEARGHDDRADVELHHFVLLLEVDRLCHAVVGAHATSARVQVDAGGSVDHGQLGDRLREGDGDRLARAEAFVPLGGEDVGLLVAEPVDVDAAGRADRGAGPALAAHVGELVERGRDDPLGPAIEDPDRRHPHSLLADANALAAQDAVAGPPSRSGYR